MGNEQRKTHCSHKDYKWKQWVIKEDSLFTQGVTMQIMGNERRVLVHTRSYNANNG
ncbi:hypothetical protein KSS87_007671 [Heliosperma pusillum]|nr:hypothetical protein KSS87_007671 [Heliosperma pusillum]KAH9604377.1 hypothetical protein KSS87_007671 [Heliosperma pusillum]